MRGGIMKPGRSTGPLNGNVDPVCGMEVRERDPQRSSENEWRIVYFCSRECKQAFDADPSQWSEVLRAQR
jgi:YHS domain-containing protein